MLEFFFGSCISGSEDSIGYPHRHLGFPKTQLFSLDRIEDTKMV